jgi:hypothetical protein
MRVVYIKKGEKNREYRIERGGVEGIERVKNKLQ